MWALSRCGTLWRRDKSLTPAGIRTLERTAHSQVTIPTVSIFQDDHIVRLCGYKNNFFCWLSKRPCISLQCEIPKIFVSLNIITQIVFNFIYFLFCKITNQNTQLQLIYRLLCSYMFRHYRVIFRQLVFITSPSYTSISIAAVGNTI